MQNWDSSLQPANYENNWYGNIFPSQIKTEPKTTNNCDGGSSISSISSSSSPPPIQQQQSSQQIPSTSLMDHYLNIKNQHLQQQGLNMNSSLTPSPPRTTDEGQQQQQQQQQQFFDNGPNHNNNSLLHQQLHHHPLGFNPLTPPGLPNAILPPINFHNHDFTLDTNQQHQHQQRSIGQSTTNHNQQQEQITKLDNNSLTPRNTPPMDITPPKSPKLGPTMMYNNSNMNNEYLMADKDQEILSNSSDLIDESEDDENVIRMPIYNSHGKMKNYKCKSCGYMAITKIAFWQHTRSHMKPEKLLQCSKCPFVTELKHHLEYHIRKHKNLKPFQCNKCNYTCVNKSMLNSHLKSHSSVYQYRCTDCDYATKYCHSFKLHLRKYDHKPGMVLDEEGLPNPSIIIDVYGTRRGPKMKSNGMGRISKSKESKLAARLAMSQQQQQQKHQQQQQQQVISPIKSDIQKLVKNQNQQQQQQQTNMTNYLPTPLANMLQQQHNMTQFFPYWNLNLQMLAAQQQAVLAQLSPQMREAAIQSLNGNTTNSINGNTNIKELKSFNELNNQNHIDDNNNDDIDDDEDDRRSETSSAMDLSSQGTPTKLNPKLEQILNMKISNDEITTPTISSSSSRRKGRVLKLDTLLTNKESSINHDDSLIIKRTNDEMDCTTTGTDKSNDNESPTSSSTLAKIDNKLLKPEQQQTSIDTTKIESIDSNTNGSSNTLTGTINIEPSTTTTTTTTATQSNNNNNTPMSGIFECKYCDIYFKDAVLYTIHMGYHSCDDVFKCNMCGEKCDGPVGLFVHMARNAHS